MEVKNKRATAIVENVLENNEGKDLRICFENGLP
jgi:hypothetical protein